MLFCATSLGTRTQCNSGEETKGNDSEHDQTMLDNIANLIIKITLGQSAFIW